MSVTKTIKDGINIIKINVSEIDVSNAESIKKRVKEELESDRDTLLDLGSINFMDSSGIGVLISSMRYMATEGVSMKICNVNKSVQAILELVRLHHIVDIYETEEEATEALLNETDAK